MPRTTKSANHPHRKVAAQFGALVAKHRKALRLTTTDLATSAATQRQMILQIEKGETNPSLGLALALAKVLRFSLDQIQY